MDGSISEPVKTKRSRPVLVADEIKEDQSNAQMQDVPKLTTGIEHKEERRLAKPTMPTKPASKTIKKHHQV